MAKRTTDDKAAIPVVEFMERGRSCLDMNVGVSHRRTAATMLLDRLAGRKVPRRRVDLGFTLVARAST